MAEIVCSNHYITPTIRLSHGPHEACIPASSLTEWALLQIHIDIF